MAVKPQSRQDAGGSESCVIVGAALPSKKFRWSSSGEARLDVDAWGASSMADPHGQHALCFTWIMNRVMLLLPPSSYLQECHHHSRAYNMLVRRYMHHAMKFTAICGISGYAFTHDQNIMSTLGLRMKSAACEPGY